MPDSVSLIQSSPQILGKFQRVVSSFSGFLVKSLINKNSRTSNDIAVNPERLSNLTREIRRRQKRLKIISCRKLHVILIFQIYVRFPTDALFNFYSISLIRRFYLSKLETKIKVLSHCSHVVSLKKRILLPKNATFLEKRAKVRAS